MKLSLTPDVLQLARVFNYFRRIIFENYKLDPAKLLTISSTAMQLALYQLGVKFYVIHGIDYVKDFEDNIRAGLVSVVGGRTISNNKHLSNFDVSKDDITTMFLDANSLYGTVLSQLLPIGEFFALPQEEVENFD